MKFQISVGACLSGLLLTFSAALADTASPAPSPSPSPSPSPPVALHAVFSATEAFTSGVNAVGSFDSPTGADRTTRFNVSNAFAILTKTSGTLQFAVQGGAYSIPTIGVAGNKTIQTNANTDLFGPLPLAYAAYVPNGNFSLSAGVLATLIGAESTFTYQDWNIQRGAVWNVENAVSRGFRAAWTSGKAVVTLGANDGFYSGKYGAAEASVTLTPDPSDSLLFVWLDPNTRTPGNPTTSVANKELLNFVFTRTHGNLQLAPYVLWARSPSAPSLGYTNSESAFGAAFLANLTVTPKFSTAFRWETLHNGSSPSDTSANADLIGYGPGSGITTWTVTPSLNLGHGAYFRVDFSNAHVTGGLPGLMFNSDGKSANQSRVVLELGTQI
jgi:putative OmpL-like beta-barrel porin-2